MEEHRTPTVEVYDRLIQDVDRGVLLATMPVILGVDTAIGVLRGKRVGKSFGNVKQEIKHRLNKGMGKGRHMVGVNI